MLQGSQSTAGWRFAMVVFLAYILTLSAGLVHGAEGDIVWTPKDQIAMATSWADNGQKIEGPTRNFTMGFGDPFPFQPSHVGYPGSCGYAGAYATAGVASVECAATAWRTANQPDPACNRKSDGQAYWAGYFAAADQEPLVFRVQYEGIGPGASSVVTGAYSTGTATGQLFKTIENYHKRYSQLSFTQSLPTQDSAICSVNILGNAEADNDYYNSQDYWNARIKINVFVCRTSRDQVTCCVEEGKLVCATIEKCMLYNSYKVRRIFPGKPAGYIGACLYAPANNADSRQISPTQFRWVNWAKGLDKVEVYTYDCLDDSVHRVGYKSHSDYLADINLYGDLTFLHIDPGKEKIYSPPPADPLTFKPFYSAAALSDKGAVQEPQRSLRAAGDTPGDTIVTPFAAIACNYTDGEKWQYRLAICDWVGVVVSPGDTLSFEGSGIQGGQVSGNALTDAYGAWKVKSATSGKVIFEAAKAARLSSDVEEFFLLAGKGSSMGEVELLASGKWIGAAGNVPGPIKPQQPGLLLLLLD